MMTSRRSTVFAVLALALVAASPPRASAESLGTSPETISAGPLPAVQPATFAVPSSDSFVMSQGLQLHRAVLSVARAIRVDSVDSVDSSARSVTLATASLTAALGDSNAMTASWRAGRTWHRQRTTANAVASYAVLHPSSLFVLSDAPTGRMRPRTARLLVNPLTPRPQPIVGHSAFPFGL